MKVFRRLRVSFPSVPLVLCLFLSVISAGPTGAAAKGTRTAIAIPGGSGGVGFDDLGFVPELGKILVPAGRTGALALIDPKSNEVTLIRKVTAASAPAPRGTRGRPRGGGTTSAVYVDGRFIASDHGGPALVVVDAKSHKVLGKAPLKSGPDYVRYVPSRHEVWVTEPGAEQIELLAFSPAGPSFLTSKDTISVPGGPESLVVDEGRGRAYANLWKDETAVIDLAPMKVAQHWKNGCAGSRGLAEDPAHGLLFVGCSEGGVSVLALDSDGKVLAHAAAGAGVDIVAFNATHRRLFVPGARSATLTVFSVATDGKLTPEGTYATARGGHCVATDPAGDAFVCDPRAGAIIKISPK